MAVRLEVPMSRPVPKHFETQILIDKAVDDPSQVPLAFALLDLYFQGATVSSESVIVPAGGAPTNVGVYDPGSLTQGNLVQAGVDGTSLEVAGFSSAPIFPNPSTVVLRNNGSVDVTVVRGTRLLVTSDRPIAFLDPLGTVARGSRVAADQDGRVVCYLKESRFDYVVRGASALALDAPS